MTDHIEVLRRLIKCASGRADFTASDAREADELLAALSAREAGAVAWIAVWNDGSGFYGDPVRGTPTPYGLEWNKEQGHPLHPLFLHPAQPASQQSYQSATDSAGIGSSQQGEPSIFDNTRCLRCGHVGKFIDAHHCASQQGEKAEVDSSGVTITEGDWTGTYAEWKKRHGITVAHPTGDRVRGLVEKCRALINADNEYDLARRDWDRVVFDDPLNVPSGEWEKVSSRFENALMGRISKRDELAAAIDQEKGR